MTEMLAALLGALVGGLTTLFVARRQFQHDLHARRLERIDELVAQLHAGFQALGMGGLERNPPDRARMESVALQASVLTARARDLSPHLASIVDVGADHFRDAMERHRSGTGNTRAPYVRSALAHSVLLGQWLRDPERFEKHRPTFESALASVDTEYPGVSAQPEDGGATPLPH